MNCCSKSVRTIDIVVSQDFSGKALVQSKLLSWQEKGLYLFYLPKYAPHLNLAETFWRKAKYEWLKPADHISFDRSKQKVTEIFTNISTKYRVQGNEMSE